MDEPGADREASRSPGKEDAFLCEDLLVLSPLEELEATYAKRCDRDKSLGESSDTMARAYELARAALTNALGTPEPTSREAGEC
jgi:hypothetical protein